ncbi:hypothetical protein HHL22_20555 [Hymenobacter sp. RP-2-7]|uniref:Uncharacterized protein n=1 Tax=Hymenobacter polaris TaxID=2682546 RepID=A0A7Y0AHY1_9BACT|nr:hypothetical protein [Hymenobacter polaris]NML67599.1 hypothetical protein [Hymenobacter polaris]
MSSLFPTRFGAADTEAQRLYQQQQRRALALCQLVATGEARYQQEIDLLDAWLLDQLKPEVYDDDSPENVLTLHRRQFGATCAAMAAQGFPRAQELSLADFHSALEHLLQKNQAE